KDWAITEIYYNFLEYFENREASEQKLRSFLGFLDYYIPRIS
ncbi:unnamed protein product, partial [marine sediment metagenome]